MGALTSKGCPTNKFIAFMQLIQLNIPLNMDGAMRLLQICDDVGLMPTIAAGNSEQELLIMDSKTKYNTSLPPPNPNPLRINPDSNVIMTLEAKLENPHSNLVKLSRLANYPH